MIALYGSNGEHPPSCTCAGCSPLEGARLADGIDTRWRKIPAGVEADYLEAVYSQRIATTDLHEGLWSEYFSRLKNHAEAGWGKRFRDAGTAAEWEFTQRVERNLREFAAHKQASVTSDLRKMLAGKDGKRERGEWEKEAKRALKRHNGLYLRAELDTAAAAAQAAESWQEFERRKYLYPNLRYETAGDERVRDSHRAIDGVVKPVDDPFWDTHTPPLGWMCRCKLVQTDEAATDLPDLSGLKVQKGFAQNPGKTGKLFGEDHPYFNHAALDRERISGGAARLHAKLSRGEVREWAKGAGFSLGLPQLGQPVTLTVREAKTVTGKPHRDAAGRNQLLYALAVLADGLRYIGTAADNGAHPNVRAWHYYSVAVGGVEYFLNLWEVAVKGGERVGVHAITDYAPDFGGP